MQFFHEFCLSLNFEIPLLGLKTFQGSSTYGKHQKDKEYPGCSNFSPITLNRPVTIEPLSTYVIKHQCPHENSCYTEGTTYRPLKTAKVKGLIYYHTMVSVNESDFPILTANQNPTPVTLQKGLLGPTFTPILEEGKRNQLFLIKKPLQVAEFLNENCQFLDVEENFEISIEDKRIIERNSEDCQEASKKTCTSSNLDTDFMKNLKGHVYQIVMKNFQYTEDRRYFKIFIITFQKKKYLSFPFLTSNVRILLMLNSRLFVKF